MNGRPALGKGSMQLLEESGMEIVSQPDLPELRAATAIPAIMETLTDVDGKFHKIIFRTVVELHNAAHSDDIKPWIVEDKPIIPHRRWWLLWIR